MYRPSMLDTHYSDEYYKLHESKIQFVENLILKGKPTEEIKKLFIAQYPKERPNTLKFCQFVAKYRISNKYPSDVTVVFRQHYARYNAEIGNNFILDVNPEDFSGKEKIQIINGLIDFYNNVLNIANQKEEFLGFHKRHLIVNIKNTIVYKRKNDAGGGSEKISKKINIDNLSSIEKLRFLELIEKIEKSDEKDIQKRVLETAESEMSIIIDEPLPINDYKTNSEEIKIENTQNKDKIEDERPKTLDEILKKIKERNLKQ